MIRQQRLSQLLFAPIDIAMLVYFRMVYGVTIFAWASKMLLSGIIEENYVAPQFHFTYAGLSWVEPLSGRGMYWLFVALGCFAILVMFGFCYRLVSVLLACGFTYIFLIDGVYYQNHYYLLCLISWIMVFVPAHRACSLDARWWPNLKSDVVPAWSLALLRFQIAVPYFFGGIAKLDSDWLHGQPMRDTLAERSDMVLLGPLLAQEWTTWFFAYGGLSFDLLVVPALCWRRTRPWAFGLAFAFHLTNSTLFHIGVFPWFMLLATVIFFPADFPRKLCKAMRGFGLGAQSTELPNLEVQATFSEEPQSSQSEPQWTAARQRGVALLAGYVLLQMAIPLRHWVYAGNPNWTEQGHRFAWHMMLRSKQCGIRYYAIDPKAESIWSVDLRPYLSEYQVVRFGRDPQMIRQLGHFLASNLRRRGYPQFRIHVLALVSLNGRKPQLLIDPDLDLATPDTTPWWQQSAWVLPLSEPFRQHGWDVPLEQWEQHVDLPAWMARGTKKPRAASP